MLVMSDSLTFVSPTVKLAFQFNGPHHCPRQVALVLHALANHTAIISAFKHRRDATSPWPEALSVGRWLHDVGNDLERIKQKGVIQPTARMKAEQPLQINSKSHHYTEDHE
ncbi:MAG TPA: hypothetical protein VFV38_13180 [Ktedonobacteraceae bacterium]|nr:hypothetical protein [Ktedonobacteraceae bacterium]